MIRLASLTVADDALCWGAIGFDVRDGRTSVGGVAFEFGPDADARGIVSWGLQGAGLDDRTDVDGLPLSAAGDRAPFGPEAHPNGAQRIDHLVVMTPDVERTVAAVESIGLACRRRREGSAYGKPMRQAFFWLGGEGQVILEVVGPPEIDPAKANDPARFFGLAFTCADLQATAVFYGELLKSPVDAVQPGRRIATLSSKAGSSVPLAFMSPHVD